MERMNSQNGIHSKPELIMSSGQTPELTQSAIRKISLLPAIKRRQSVREHHGVTSDASKEDHRNDGHKDDQSSTPSQSNVMLDSASETSTISSRYTISSRFGAASEEGRAAMTSHSKPVIFVDTGPSAEGRHFSKPSFVTPMADFATHRGETSQIQAPPINDDFVARLEGLKQCRAWSERIREASKPHGEPHRPSISKAAKNTPKLYGLPVSLSEHSKPNVSERQALPNLDVTLRHGPDVMKMNINASTPLPTSQVAPIPIKSTGPGKDPQVTLSISPGGLNLHAKPSGSRSRTSTRSFTISSTPMAQLEQQSRSRSTPRSKLTARPQSCIKEKKYPPVSFPKAFTELEPKPATQLPRSNSSRNPTPSISPLTRPKSGQEIKDHREPLGTPHDHKDRPVFYGTIHYYTECPHSFPPATRPLDPDAQPRKDPDFHPRDPKVFRSIIPGRCFNCDTIHRRAQENVALEEHTEKITELKDQLARLIDQLEIVDTGSDSDEGDYTARLQNSCRFDEDAYDLRHQLSSSTLPPSSDEPSRAQAAGSRVSTANDGRYASRLIGQIRCTEAAIDELRDGQDATVKAVWEGYKRRWGPATLGVQRGAWASDPRKYETRADHDAMLEHLRRSIDQRLDLPDEISKLALDDDDDDEVQVVGVVDNVDKIPCGASTHGSPDRLRSRTTSRSEKGRFRSRSETPSSRGTDMTNTGPSTYREHLLTKTPGEGKMRTGWVRE